MPITKVCDILTPAELEAIPAEQLNNPLSYMTRSYEELLLAAGLDASQPEKYVLLVYDEAGELDYMQDLTTPTENGIKGLALELPYSFEFRDDIDIIKIRELVYNVQNPSRASTVAAYRSITESK